MALEVFTAMAMTTHPTTAAEIGRSLGLEDDVVAQQIEDLQRHDLVEPVTDDSVAETRYRLTHEWYFSDEDWAQLGLATRRRLTCASMEKMEERMWSAMARGGFDADDVNLTFMIVDLDREGYDAVVRLGAEVIERIRDIQASVVQRRADGTGDGESIQSNFMMLHFQNGEEGTVPPDDPEEDREALFRLSEDVTDELSMMSPDWQAVAAPARHLAALVQRYGATQPDGDPVTR